MNIIDTTDAIKACKTNVSDLRKSVQGVIERMESMESDLSALKFVRMLQREFDIVNEHPANSSALRIPQVMKMHAEEDNSGNLSLHVYSKSNKYVHDFMISNNEMDTFVGAMSTFGADEWEGTFTVKRSSMERLVKRYS